MSWLTTNISKRLINHNENFEVYIKKSNFEKVCFEVAADNVAKSIAHEKIFVAFSGGYDSEFIVRRLHKLGINFVPVIVELEGLEYERAFAYKALRELKIEAKIIKLSITDFLKIYYEKIYKTINGTSWPSTHYVACEYATNEGGLFVDGGHILGDGDDLISNFNYYLPEWDFYSYVLFPNTKICNFFIHTPQIAYSTLNVVNDSDITWSDYKERVFNLRFRPKVRPQDSYEPKLKKFLTQTLEDMREYKPKTKVFFGTKENLKKMISD